MTAEMKSHMTLHRQLITRRDDQLQQHQSYTSLPVTSNYDDHLSRLSRQQQRQQHNKTMQMISSSYEWNEEIANRGTIVASNNNDDVRSVYKLSNLSYNSKNCNLLTNPSYKVLETKDLTQFKYVNANVNQLEHQREHQILSSSHLSTIFNNSKGNVDTSNNVNIANNDVTKSEFLNSSEFQSYNILGNDINPYNNNTATTFPDFDHFEDLFSFLEDGPSPEI
jgi:hypothetical protein